MSESQKKTGAEKAAQDNKAEVDNVVASDPTAVNPRLEAAGINTAGTGEGAVLVKADGTIEGSLYDESAGPASVTLKKDVVEEFYFPGTARPAHRIKFTAGQTVPKSVIDELNARSAAAKASSDKPSLVDYVDSSTLQAGTGANTPGVESTVDVKSA